MDDTKDWLANAKKGVSRREFMAGAAVTGVSLAGFAIAAGPVAAQVITTSAEGLVTTAGTVSVKGFPVPVYEARPSASGRYPVVLVIPEVFGMHEYIKDVTRRFAKAGFLGVTFEPYAREGGVLQLPDMAAVMKVTNSVPDAQVMGDLDTIVAAVKQNPSARPDEIGVNGFCKGGMYTLLFAAHNHEVKAAVAWYGIIKPPKTPGIRTVGPLDVAAQIKCPVLGLYGDADQANPVADVKEMEAALKAAGTVAEFVEYPGAPHAFHADYRPSYRPEAAKDGWARCVKWFDKYLKS